MEGLQVSWFYFKCLLIWNLQGTRTPTLVSIPGRRRPGALCCPRDVLQDVKREKKRSSKARLGEGDQRQTLDQIRGNRTEITITQLLSFEGLKRHACWLCLRTRSGQRKSGYSISCRHFSTSLKGGTEAILALTHLRSYRKGYSERHEGAGKSCR